MEAWGKRASKMNKNAPQIQDTGAKKKKKKPQTN